MAKRLNCATCIYLNMHKKEFSENGHNYRYGCIVTTKEEKQKFHRNMARARKENYLKQCRKS